MGVTQTNVTSTRPWHPSLVLCFPMVCMYQLILDGCKTPHASGKDNPAVAIIVKPTARIGMGEYQSANGHDTTTLPHDYQNSHYYHHCYHHYYHHYYHHHHYHHLTTTTKEDGGEAYLIVFDSM